jgi:photosystem II stability/assembly factor-like uncharacterized protein
MAEIFKESLNMPTNIRAFWLESLSIAAVSLLFFLTVDGMYAQTKTAPANLQSVGLQSLRYRFIGPEGNRVEAVVGVPGDANTYYMGAASGGVWKSSDGGTNWKPIFDDQDAQSIGSLAIAPSDSNVVWAGTGEAFIRSGISIGNGIYKSTDAGKTWSRMGLDKTGRIGRIVIDPHNPDIVFAAALGTCYGPQQERGVFRTTDGGKTWDRVLFVDENTGAADVAMDPNNSQILFAGMWQIDIKTWGKWSGGPGSGVFVSRDGGTKWTRLIGHGLPDPPLGRIGVSIAPSNSNWVYADIETGSRGVVWRSEDGGQNWKVVSYNRDLNSRPHYNTRMTISPVNPREIYIIADLLNVSYDGGEQTTPIKFADNHDMWIDPRNPNRMAIADDGGVEISTNHGANWQRSVVPIAQIYHVYADKRIPYYVYANEQDKGSVLGPSNNLSGRSISTGDWIAGAVGESGFMVPDPVDNNIIWGSSYGGWIDVWDFRTHQYRNVNPWPKTSMGSPAGLLKYRFHWTAPIAISPFDHNKVYVGSQYVHQTTDGGQTWKVISPDLTTGDPSKLLSSGGLTEDNLGPEYGETVWAIAESTLEKGLIWAGTNDGLVHVTRDGGARWTNVTSAIPNLPPLGTISNIEPSIYDAGTAYISVDLHQVDNRDPFVYKTTDYGKTWRSISSDLPKNVFSYVHCVREDPVRKGLLYLGTENGLYVTFNDGEHWETFQNNLPHAPVDWLEVQPQFNDLIVGTYGRGIWIMDDITPLQELTRQVVDSEVTLLPPRPAYRFASRTARISAPNDQSEGRNPPYGASIHYVLKSAPAADVTVSIYDEAGQLVRTLHGSKIVGVNRLWWDLRYEPPKSILLRTTPPTDPHVWEKQEYRDARLKGGFRLLRVYRADDGNMGVHVAPGTYKVKLSVGARSSSQKLVVKKDPSAAGTEADIRAQVSASLAVIKDVNSIADAMNQIEWIREELENLSRFLDQNNGDPSVKTATAAISKKFSDVEAKFSDPSLAESDWKRFRNPLMLYGEYLELNFNIIRSADFPPTEADLEVTKEFHQELEATLSQLDQLITNDLPTLNKMLDSKNSRGIFTPKR